MSCYIIELADCALTPYAIETESGTEYGWGLDELLRVADECDAADVDGVTDWPEVDWDATYYEEDELLKIADMRKRNPSDSAERRFFMLVEQALGAHQ